MKNCLLLIIMSSSFVLQGCSFLGPHPDDPKFAPPPAERIVAPKNTSGSLYQPGYALSLFEDDRARRIGDILTVNLVENTKGSKSTGASVKKETKNDLNDATVFGRKTGLGTHNTGVEVDGSTDFKGSADASKSNDLSGIITVSIIDVMPNGYLKVTGEKWVTINQGDEYIRLTGIVRPSDIKPDNSVDSNRLANARIAYSGRGQDNASSKMGWFARFFVSSFFPI